MNERNMKKRRKKNEKDNATRSHQFAAPTYVLALSSISWHM